MSFADDWISYSNAHHYTIDGVPMKINSSFQPKQFKDDLPDDIQVDSSTSKALKFSYAFETENGYISWYEDYVQECEARRLDRKKRDEVAKNEQQMKKVAKPEISLPSVTNTSPLPVVPQPATTKSTIKTPADKPDPPPICNTILMPQRASPVTVTAAISANNASAVNIKDFENLGEDPFESAELKTINDLEELKSLLSQNITCSQPSAAATDGADINGLTADVATFGDDRCSTESALTESKDPPINNTYVNVFIRQPPKEEDIYENTTELRKSIPRPQSVMNVKLPVPAPRACNSEPTSPESYTAKLPMQEVKPDQRSQTASEPLKDDMSISAQAKKPAVKPKPKLPKVVPTSTTTSGNVASLSNVIERDLNSAIQSKNKNGKLVGFSYTNVPTCKGSDTIKNIEWPSMDAKSPPTTAITTSPFEKTLITSTSGANKPTVAAGEFPSKSNQRFKPSRPPPPAPQKTGSKYPQASSSNGISAANGFLFYNIQLYTTPKVPAYRKFSDSIVNGKAASHISSDHVTDSLLAMGFDRVHINAAVRNLGDNTNALVEHLCALQKLASNKSIRWQHAQEGLLLFQTDIEKAEKYARAHQQLSEIGFDADKIKSALIANDMDTEKALGQLVT